MVDDRLRNRLAESATTSSLVALANQSTVWHWRIHHIHASRSHCNPRKDLSASVGDPFGPKSPAPLIQPNHHNHNSTTVPSSCPHFDIYLLLRRNHHAAFLPDQQRSSPGATCHLDTGVARLAAGGPRPPREASDTSTPSPAPSSGGSPGQFDSTAPAYPPLPMPVTECHPTLVPSTSSDPHLVSIIRRKRPPPRRQQAT